MVDHIKPRSRYPALELTLTNLQVLCNDCNMGKSNDDETDFRPDNWKTLLFPPPDENAELIILSEARERLE